MPTRYNSKGKSRFGVAPLPSGYDGNQSPTFSLPPVGLEDTDRALFRLFDNEIPLQVKVQDGMKKVPVIFAAGERWALLKKGAPRDNRGSLILPIIVIGRTNISQSPNDDIAGRGINQQTGDIVIRRRLDSSDRGYQGLVNRLFIRNQLNVAVGVGDDPIYGQITTGRTIGIKKNVWETIVIPAPQFYTATYEVIIWANYIQHMNQIVENIVSSFLPQGNQWRLDTDKGYWFIATVDGNLYNAQNNFEDFSQEERMVKYQFTIKVPSYILASATPGAPVPVRRYVSNPDVSFSTSTDDSGDVIDVVDDPYLGADDPTLPHTDYESRTRGQRNEGKTRLYPGKGDISPHDPALESYGRNKPSKYRKVIGLDGKGNPVTKFVKVKAKSTSVGLTEGDTSVGLTEGDTTPPTFTWAVDSTGLIVTGTGSETLNTTVPPAAGQFTFSGCALNPTASSTAFVGGDIQVTLNDSILATDAPKISYVVPGSNPLRDLAGNDAAAITNAAITNNSTQVLETLVNVVTSGTSFSAPGGGAGLVELWGGGGAGLTNSTGGGGGAYARKAVTWVKGQSYTYALGAGGSTDGSNGASSTFETTLCVAAGGTGGTGGGTGGAAGSCVGDQAYSGGDGATGGGTQSGGGSAGSNSAASAAIPGDPDGGRGATSTNNGEACGGRCNAVGYAGGRNGYARFTFPRAASQAFPWIHSQALGVRTTDNSLSTTITLPSGDSGDLLVVIIGVDGNPTVSMDVDWTKKGQASAGTACTLAVFTQYATGSETTAVNLSTPEQGEVYVLRIKGANATMTNIELTSSTGTSTNADLGVHTPSGGSANYLFVQCCFWDNIPSVTDFPPGYENNVRIPAYITTGGVMALGTKKATASAENPGAYASEADDWAGYVISIPAA